jgi:hypothetical protein
VSADATAPHEPLFTPSRGMPLSGAIATVGAAKPQARRFPTVLAVAASALAAVVAGVAISAAAGLTVPTSTARADQKPAVTSAPAASQPDDESAGNDAVGYLPPRPSATATPTRTRTPKPTATTPAPSATPTATPDPVDTGDPGLGPVPASSDPAPPAPAETVDPAPPAPSTPSDVPSTTPPSDAGAPAQGEDPSVTVQVSGI